MKEIKAYVHSNRVAGVIAALKSSSAWDTPSRSEHNLSVYVVKGSLAPLIDSERHYSIDLGDEVINEYKLELHCADEHVDELVAVIRREAHTGQVGAGWIYVIPIEQAVLAD